MVRRWLVRPGVSGDMRGGGVRGFVWPLAGSAFRGRTRRGYVLALSVVTLAAAAMAFGAFLMGARAATTTTTFNAVADAYVSQNRATTNFGTMNKVRVQDSPILRTYLRFDLQGLTGTITKATLRIHTAGAATIGFDVRSSANSSWGETTITYANAPAPGATAVASSGTFANGAWLTLDVKPLVTGNGLVSFVLTTTNTNAISLDSRESGAATTPQLIVETTTDLPATNTAPPTISGTAQDGQTLTADKGTWSGTDPITYVYQWRRCDNAGNNCSNIAGATGTTYTLAPADVGSTVRVVVTGSNAAGSSSATSTATAVVVAAPPANTAVPTISGTAQDGQTLTALPGTWSGTPPISYTYQWRRCDPLDAACADIAGATSSTYTLTAADVGWTTIVRVTASNAAGSASASSAETTVVAPAPPANTALPTVSGTAQDGQTLTASTGTWSGTPPISYAYQWRRCNSGGGSCTDIAGATNPSYTVTAADVGSTIRAAVTASNSAGSSSASSAATAVVAARAPVNTALPTISGTAQEGQTLTAAPGSWSGTAPISYAYQWRRCDSAGNNCADIVLAGQQSYTPVAADVGSTLRVAVTASNGGGSASASSDKTAVVTAAPATPPVNTAAPTISGSAQDGQTLTADKGTWTGSQPISYSYQWRRCNSAGNSCADIAAATNTTYTLIAADVGSTIRIAVTAANAGGSGTASSAQTALVTAAPPANTALPTISGNAQDGQTLTADKGSWTGSAPITYSYQWRRCNSAGNSCSDIAGATNTTHTLAPADVGSTLRVTVTASNAAGSAGASSAATAVVTAASPVNTALPTISGTAQEGQTLTAAPGAWSGTSPITYTYQWRRCNSAGNNCSDIVLAGEQSYTLTAAEVGSTIRVAVTASNAGGSGNATSAQTAVVAAAAPANSALPTISGTAQQGQTLTASTGTWSGTAPITYTYQWRRCDGAGSNCTDLGGATNTTYTLSAADVAATMRVTVTASNSAGSSSATSAATAQVQAAPPANSVLPTISGTARDGEVLTAEPGAWLGTDPIDYAYQWLHCDSGGGSCTDIAGATHATYTVTAADVGATLRVAVTGTNAAGSGGSTSSATAVVAAAATVTTAPPATRGPQKAGQTLTASTGTWSGTPPIGYAYQWRRCDSAGNNCVDIVLASQQSYTPTAVDVGSTLRVRVTASNAAGSASASSDKTAVVTAAPATPPVNTAAPTISGSAQDGQTLTADKGTWTGSQPIGYAYQWRRCDGAGSNCGDIAGATNTTYALVSADVGSALRVTVTASNAGGSGTATSAATAAVAGIPPANTALPTISGTTQDGQTLTASPGTWSGTTPITYAYQWRRCNSGGNGCSSIAGATNGTHALVSADVGSTLRVVVTASNAGGSASATSAQTAVVTAAPPANTALPTIAGTAQDGQTLTADKGTWTGTAPITYAYQWRCSDSAGNGCTDIAGATSTTYALTSADVTSTLRVAVTASNTAGSSSATSAATAVVAGAAPVNTAPPTISGTAQEEQTLTADKGAWSGTPPLTFAYRWRRCDSGGGSCSDIAGATNPSYTVTAADVGSTIRLAVTASNAAGSSSASSAATAVVGATAPVNTALPTISGTAQEGQTLTAAPGTWAGTAPISYAYQWRRR